MIQHRRTFEHIKLEPLAIYDLCQSDQTSYLTLTTVGLFQVHMQHYH